MHFVVGSLELTLAEQVEFCHEKQQFKRDSGYCLSMGDVLALCNLLCIYSSV